MSFAVALHYALVIPFLFGFWAALRRLAFDRHSKTLLLAGFLLYFSYFFTSQWSDFLHDAPMHAEYVKYIADTHRLPETFAGAMRHPPFFYIGSAFFYNIGEWAGAAEPMNFARYFPALMYLVFIVFAGLAIREVFAQKQKEYYFALAMLVFWPVGVTKIGAVLCDIATYASGMGVIYFIVRWLRCEWRHALPLAFVASGFAVLAKNSGLMMIIITALFVVHGLWRRSLKIDAKLAASAAFALLCAWSTFTHPVGYDFQGGESPIPHTSFAELALMYLYFNPYEFISSTMINPHNGEPITVFWHYYPRSLLLGDYIHWKSLGTVWAFGCVWLGIIVYILYGLWKVKRFPAAEAPALRFLMAMAALYTGLLLYMFSIVAHPTQIADARYVYPIVCVIAVFYAKAMEWHRLAGRNTLWQLGSGLAYGFVALTLCLFAAQNFLLDGIH